VNITVYKIRDTATGLFSTGGIRPKWTKCGKTWSSVGSVKSHLTLITQGDWDYDARAYAHHDIPTSWEVVPFTYQSTEDKPFSAAELAARPAKK